MISTPGNSIISMILSGVAIAFVISVPILVILTLIRAARIFVTPQQKEMKRLLEEVVELLKENNRLLSQQRLPSPMDPLNRQPG